MSDARALQPAALDPSRARLASVELELAVRETELAAMSLALQELQEKYLGSVGAFYRELVELGNAIFEEEVRAGLRCPEEPGDVSAQARRARGRRAAREPASRADWRSTARRRR